MTRFELWLILHFKWPPILSSAISVYQRWTCLRKMQWSFAPNHVKCLGNIVHTMQWGCRRTWCITWFVKRNVKGFVLLPEGLKPLCENFGSSREWRRWICRTFPRRNLGWSISTSFLGWSMIEMHGVSIGAAPRRSQNQFNHCMGTLDQSMQDEVCTLRFFIVVMYLGHDICVIYTLFHKP